MKKFNVIIEHDGKFEPYDVMEYLINTWYEFVKKAEPFQEEPDNYWKIPTTYEGYKKWIDHELKYMYWSRCEYEIVLLQWPNLRNEPGEKIDIYWQCQMNIDVITDLFIENIESNQYQIPLEYNNKIIKYLKKDQLFIELLKTQVIFESDYFFNILTELINQFPQQRFGQIICNYIFPKYRSAVPEKGCSVILNYIFPNNSDPFFEESEKTLKRLQNFEK